ncbi:MAG TPA: diguanylate cyclase [Sedimentisphaerales bacterium]|nr:diguanylate cyclase [Sedimentisphaerales bacterium]
MADKISDIKQVCNKPKQLLTILEDAPVRQAALVMKSNNVGCLVVLNKDNGLVGIIAERDILYKTVITGTTFEQTLVKEVMTKNTLTCTMNDSIEAVEKLMTEHNIRHTPVLVDRTPIAMVSIRDIIAYRLQANKAMRTAAEELTMLSTGLKSLDFDDVIELAINQVPKSFKAQNSVLFLKTKNAFDAIIHRNNCPIPEVDLSEPEKLNELAESKEILSCKRHCPECNFVENSLASITIPLTVFGHSTRRDYHHIAMQGFLCMCNFKTSNENSEDLRKYKASLLRDLLNANMTNAKLYHDYQNALQRSQTDPLTGVGTRLVLEQMLDLEYQRACRYNTTFSIAIIDLDHFKEINDLSGHPEGDKALKKLAKLITKSMRTTDVIARYGGDEFMLIMPETNAKDAMRLVERVRRQAKTISVTPEKNISISCGLTQWSGMQSDSLDNILQRADSALYEAKANGRDKVVMHQPEKTITPVFVNDMQ